LSSAAFTVVVAVSKGGHHFPVNVLMFIFRLVLVDNLSNKLPHLREIRINSPSLDPIIDRHEPTSLQSYL